MKTSPDQAVKQQREVRLRTSSKKIGRSTYEKAIPKHTEATARKKQNSRIYFHGPLLK